MEPEASEEITAAPPTDHAHPRGEAPGEYRPWRRPLTYVVFSLGMTSLSMLSLFFVPQAIVLGIFALGCGIPAVVLANKEISRAPEAAEFGFVKWGKRAGMIGIVAGPIVAALWIVAIVVLGVAMSL